MSKFEIHFNQKKPKRDSPATLILKPKYFFSNLPQHKNILNFFLFKF